MFSVTVPKASAVETPLPDRASPAGTAVSIMVVEDEEDVLDIMVQVAHAAGPSRSMPAGLPPRCKRFAQRRYVAGAAPVDLIIADYRLGDGITGVDAIEALCAHIGHSVPAVIVTGRYLAVAHQGSHRRRSSYFCTSRSPARNCTKRSLQPVSAARNRSIAVAKRMCGCPQIGDHPTPVEIVSRR